MWSTSKSGLAPANDPVAGHGCNSLNARRASNCRASGRWASVAGCGYSERYDFGGEHLARLCDDVCEIAVSAFDSVTAELVSILEPFVGITSTSLDMPQVRNRVQGYDPRRC